MQHKVVIRSHRGWNVLIQTLVFTVLWVYTVKCTHVDPSGRYGGSGSWGRARWVDPFWRAASECASPVTITRHTSFNLNQNNKILSFIIAITKFKYHFLVLPSGSRQGSLSDTWGEQTPCEESRTQPGCCFLLTPNPSYDQRHWRGSGERGEDGEDRERRKKWFEVCERLLKYLVVFF